MFKHYISVVFITFQSLVLIVDNQIQDKEILGKIVGITDGDTFKLLKKDSVLIKIRIANIDCPEKKQPYSEKAKQFTSQAIFNKNIKLESLKKDLYGRFICHVIYDDSLNLGHELLKQGLAWRYIKYSKDSYLKDLEDLARSNKVGLWQDEHAIPPWKWRDNKKKPKP
ncbi:thermonuclease family protein [Flavivirga sp. 57AJ16]|uniref:thermonuclease family protein n=1 Tax=Flavivirga sp. 57AJ16 TaxID=3025307 RepID=UPI002365CBD0|nr:thermonuclease family protein [Flavivirga sp. 57AJ16]MDD7887100.1 thermonuclease family protein [Flavivirga sp. 57AJ16]